MNIFWSGLFFFFTLAAHGDGGKIVAIESGAKDPVRVGQILRTGAESKTYLGTDNSHVKLAPYSAGQFIGHGNFRLLRGSAFLENESEKTVATSGVEVQYSGRVLLSFDYKEKSSSSFVIQGWAKLKNPYEPSHIVALEKNHGATMVVGDIYPGLIRQLDLASLDQWLKGYSWSEADRQAFLRSFPKEGESIPEKVRPGFGDLKLQDYFTTTTNDQGEGPDYYERKMEDSGKTSGAGVAKRKQSKGKEMSPEEAALVQLPNTKIDLDMGVPVEFLSAKQRQEEIQKQKEEAIPERRPASLVRYGKTGKKPAKSAKAARKPEIKIPAVSESGDPDVDAALARLRGVNAPPSDRGPASQSEPVPDPVYDYSENF